MSMVPRDAAADMTTRPLVNDHPDVSLMLSIGEPPSETRKYPTRLPCFRAKPGREGQWASAAAAFDRQYRVERNADGSIARGPAVVPVHFTSNRVEDVLDNRYLAFGQDRLAARGDTNFTVDPQAYGRPEWVTAYPIDTPPVRFQIQGPNDPLCLGGQYDIPVIMERGKPSGKPALAMVTTLYFVLAEVGSFISPVAISTKSAKSRSRLLVKLLQVSVATGTLASWLFLLVVKPDRVTYRDDAGKRHSAPAYTWDLIGPIRSLADRTPLAYDEMKAELAQLYERGQLSPQPRADVPALDVGPAAAIEAPDEVVDGVVVEGDDDV